MKRIYFYSLFVLIVVVSCQNSQQTTSSAPILFDSSLILPTIEPIVEVESKELIILPDSIDYMKFPRITTKEYDKLQLFKVKDIAEYDISYIAKGDVILSNEKGKIVSIYIVTNSEISEFLLSYNQKGDLIDSILVAYEDFVEYYSQISSFINTSGLTVQTVNFNYEEEEETSDTITVKYELTAELKFKQN